MKKLCYKCLHYGEPVLKSKRAKYSVCYAPVYVDKLCCAKCEFGWFFSEPTIN